VLCQLVPLAMCSVSNCRLSSSFLVSGSRDLTIKLWCLPQTDLSHRTVLPLQSKLTQKAHDKEIQSLAVSPNDKLIASGSRDKKAKVFGYVPPYCCGFFVQKRQFLIFFMHFNS